MSVTASSKAPISQTTVSTSFVLHTWSHIYSIYKTSRHNEVSIFVACLFTLINRYNTALTLFVMIWMPTLTSIRCAVYMYCTSWQYFDLEELSVQIHLCLLLRGSKEECKYTPMKAWMTLRLWSKREYYNLLTNWNFLLSDHLLNWYVLMMHTLPFWIAKG